MVVFEISTNELLNTCFVMMPFNPTFQSEYETVIKPAIEKVGLTPIRADEIYSKPNIMGDIWKCIRSCQVVIAELTGKNPNVFYELGLAHSIGKPALLLTRNSEDVPFDLRAIRFLQYNIEDPYWGVHLSESIIEMLHNILDKTHEGIVFEDITIKGDQTYSKKAIPVKTDFIDVSGSWKGTMFEGAIPYNLDLNIEQVNTELKGKMLVNWVSGGESSSIEETLDGSIQGNKITLFGTSYSYIEMGASTGYNVDNYEMELSSDQKELKGASWSGEGQKKLSGTVTLRKG